VGKTGVADENNPPILRRFPKDGGEAEEGEPSDAIMEPIERQSVAT